MEKKLVFVIEEKEQLRKFLGTILIKNYRVLTFADDLSAMAVLSKGEIPEVLIISIRREHKHKKNWGLQFINDLKISGLFRDIPVVAIMDGQVEKTGLKLKDLGVEDIFYSPFDPEHLLTKIGFLSGGFKSA